MRNIRRDVAQVARLALPYFRSEERWAGGRLLAAIFAIELAQVGIAVLLNAWHARFYDALQHKDTAAFGHELLTFVALAAGFILLAVYQLYLSQGLQIRWRQWLTGRLISAWLADSTQYRLQLAPAGIDNPDQRIAEDVKQFVAYTLSLMTGLLGAVLTLASFMLILWRLSDAAPFSVFGWAMAIPGYMVWLAFAYAMAGTWLAHRIGKPLVGLDIEQQRREADLRRDLLCVREHAEQIALLKGETAEHARLMTRFHWVRQNWTQIMARQKRLTFFTAGYGQVQAVVPILAAGPAYFAGAIGLGGLMQTASAFGRVEGALSFFIKAYPQLAEWKAVMERLDGFERQTAATGSRRTKLDVVACEAQGPIRAADLKLAKPDSSPLISIADLELAAGEMTLLSGPSGLGKSTLLRALAGIWPNVEGRLEIPADIRAMVLPQRPYLPHGSLRAAIMYPYPAAATPCQDRRLVRLMSEVGLSALAPRLDEEANWQQRLSLGEQQRLTMVRAMLFAPDWLFLDEATASLDEAAEALIYARLRQELPHASIVSIGHRSTLRPLHDRIIEIRREEAAGPARLRHQPRLEARKSA